MLTTLGPHRWCRRAAGLLAAALVTVITVITATSLPANVQASPPGDRDITAVLFEWRFDSIARACQDTLGPKGYGFVQVSPPQEHIQGWQWWTSYQPVSYHISGRLGDRNAFRAMAEACHGAGVKVIVDAVINHMTAGSGTGTGGTNYNKYDYPGFYQVQDFHSCREHISDYRNRYEVQECELLGLADLNTGSDYVRGRVAGYLNDLLSLGADGFRIDAAKHIAASDLAAIRSRMSNPDAYWIQEVIYGAGEAVQPSEYLGTGDVQEFRYARDLKRVFQNEKLAYLRNYGEGWGYLSSGKAGVFVDNHDTERNGETLSYKNGSDYTLANVFMLAWPYGAPHVHSGYEFSDRDAGPPNGGHVNACYSDGWKCQHAWRQIANMVGFRNAAAGTGVTNWWDNGNDQIAFGRGDRAFVAINQEGGTLTRTFQTSLPTGTYCDVQHGDPTTSGGCTGPTYTVNSLGQFAASIGPGDAVALYRGATGSPTPDPSQSPSDRVNVTFAVTATTVWGQNVFVVGDHPDLGSWNPDRALPMSAASYPQWRLTTPLSSGIAIQYKYIRKESNGQVTWENGSNRTATIPNSGTLTLTDNWRN
ncbi:carbohydrate-binding module family 20 domain-containing protein [Salinispora mooreana]|uniref:carbohydrate-binding module family 20 domain-containing protein n=1 Tax=Salinispora mooreana TaxID=999545 RepID=UPI000365A95A|nr:carbohydrate-binding module family 20 domain-containing protein [Salinispora mooreana]